MQAFPFLLQFNTDSLLCIKLNQTLLSEHQHKDVGKKINAKSQSDITSTLKSLSLNA